MPTYQEALREARTVGAGHASDPVEMALFCAGPLQLLAGAVAPRLVWEGAQTRGLTTDQLAAMCLRDVGAVAELQWA